jgi:DNA-binding transcriptional MerR regulator
MESYSAGEARLLTGATQRQLDYWDQTELMPASVRRSQGKGKERRYSFADLVRLRVVVHLRNTGISLFKIRRALRFLKKWDVANDSFACRRVVTDGQDIFVTTPDPSVLKSVLRPGQLVFSVFLLGDVIKEASRNIDLYTQGKATG